MFHCKTLQNLPKFGLLVWENTIWQPCINHGQPKRLSFTTFPSNLKLILRFFLSLIHIHKEGTGILKPAPAQCICISGLPDGMFWNQNSNFVGIFYGHLVHFTVFWYILWTFGIFCGNFSRFSILYQEKSGNPDAYILKCPFMWTKRLTCFKHNKTWKVNVRQGKMGDGLG
jgi:hypothetical protein